MDAMHEEMLAEKQEKVNNMNGLQHDAAGASAPLSDRSSDRSSTAPLSVRDVERLVLAIEQAQVDIAPDYKTWCEVGFALADGLGEAGREYYHRISRFYHDYDAAATDVQFNKCLNGHGEGITIATLFHYAKAAGASASLSDRSVISPLSVSRSGDSNGALAAGASTPLASTPLSDRDTISDKIDVDKLPPLLRKVMSKSLSAADADLLLLGSLTCLSACMPHLCGVYDGMTVYSNLFFFANAPASSGKGRLSLCKLLVMPIHQALRQEYSALYAEYRRNLAIYTVNKKSGEFEEPQEPPLLMLFIPANSSATIVYQMLNENDGTGLIFETEGDTLANTFSSDHGDFSPGLRQAFHHETISYARRKDKEYVELNQPKFSVLLSGTPQQVNNLIKDAENGLFSRFMFYCMPFNLGWRNPFSVKDKDETLDAYFGKLGEVFFSKVYKPLKTMAGDVMVVLTEAQEARFNAFFEWAQQSYYALFGNDIVGSVRRLGLIAFRIAMILTALRLEDAEGIDAVLVCNDDDFNVAMTIVEQLLQHTSLVFQQLDGQQERARLEKTPKVLRGVDAARELLSRMPESFSHNDWVFEAEKMGFSLRSAHRYLADIKEKKLVASNESGTYNKVK